MSVLFFKPKPGESPGVANPMAAVPANAPRPITASAEKLNLTSGPDRVEKRPTSAWQTSAWQYFDSIGEVHFAFSLIGQIMSRVRLFAAMVDQPDQPPVPVMDFLESIKTKAQADAPMTSRVLEEANKLVDELISRAQGGIANMLRVMGINFCITGEMYLFPYDEKWVIASTDELTQMGDRVTYRRRKIGTATGQLAEVQLPANTFIARVWRSHPRWSSEPDSSMLGALDDCEELVLLQQALRTMTRSRMHAGIMFIPEGVLGSNSELSLEEQLAASAMESVNNEEALETVVPLIARGSKELGDGIKWIPFGRQVDEPFVQLLDRTLQRVLQGLDIPKDIVTGLADVKYSNAIVVDENLYRAHVEPLVLMIVDALTRVYLKPMLKKRLGTSVPASLIDRIVMWADTSDIVTRPDKSQAANEGYDKGILSASAWRDARGFSDTDAPDEEEILFRLAWDRAQISPEIADRLIKRLAPKFFEAARDDGNQLPTEIESLLGNEPASEEMPAVPDDLSSLDTALSGGEVSPNGQMPPQPQR